MRLFKADKVQNTFADIFRYFVRFDKGRHLVKTVLFHDGNNLVRVDTHKFVAHAVPGIINRERFCMGREFRQCIVVHAQAAIAKAGVQFQDNLFGHIQVADRVSARGGKANATIRQDGGHLDNGDLRCRHDSGTYKISHFPEMGVDIADIAAVYRLAHERAARFARWEKERHCCAALP